MTYGGASRALIKNYNSSDAVGGIWPQVLTAVQTAAYNILQEDPATTDHANRVMWANLAFQNVVALGCVVAYGVLQDPVIQAIIPGSPTDAQIQTSVDGLISALVTGMVG